MERKKIIEKKSILIIIIVIVLIITDQFSKMIMIKKDITIIPNFFSLTYIENRGIAFSTKWKMTLIILISLLLIFSIIYGIIKSFKYKKIPIILAVILSGSLGNMIDRLFRRYVIDFINIKFLNFPIFNLADIMITLGIIILTIELIKNQTKGWCKDKKNRI